MLDVVRLNDGEKYRARERFVDDKALMDLGRQDHIAQKAEHRTGRF